MCKDKEGSWRSVGLGSTKCGVKKSGGSHFRVRSSGCSGGEGRKKRWQLM